MMKRSELPFVPGAFGKPPVEERNPLETEEDKTRAIGVKLAHLERKQNDLLGIVGEIEKAIGRAVQTIIAEMVSQREIAEDRISGRMKAGLQALQETVERSNAAVADSVIEAIDGAVERIGRPSLELTAPKPKNPRRRGIMEEVFAAMRPGERYTSFTLFKEMEIGETISVTEGEADVSKALIRLAATGKIERIRRNLYVRN